MPKFSIIITSYNGEKYVNNCLSSLKFQSFKDFETIFIDDGSDDKTETIVKKYKFISYYKIPHSGVSFARNYGIAKSQGDYFLFLDIDDYIAPNLLEILNNFIKKNVDIVKYDYVSISDYSKNSKCEEYRTKRELTGLKAFELLAQDKKPFDLICIYLYRKKFWLENKFEFSVDRFHEDFGIIPYIILKASKVIVVDFPGYYYIQTENSITRNDDYKKKLKKADDYLFHYDNLFKMVATDKNIPEYTKKIFNSYIANGVLAKSMTLKFKDRKKYLKELEKRNVSDYLLDDSIPRKVKKWFIKISPYFYYKIRG